MTTWAETSDSRGRFYDANPPADGATTSESQAIHDLTTFLLSEIVSKSYLTAGDVLLEVNPDTGRIIAAFSPNEQCEQCRLDGCSVRVQGLQDLWYDLDESGVSPEEFSERIDAERIRVAQRVQAELKRAVQEAPLVTSSRLVNRQLILCGTNVTLSLNTNDQPA